MGFTLHITITGMCLFVPDLNAKRVHVLLLAPDQCLMQMPGGPAGPGSKPMPPDRHYPRLFYPRKYEVGSTRSDIGCIPLDDKVLDLTAFAPKGTSTGIPPAVLDITPVGGGVDHKFIGMNPPETVAAHIILPLASNTDYCDSGMWQLGSKQAMVPFEVTWNIDTSANTLDWSLAGLQGTESSMPLVPLSPQPDANNNPMLELRIKNVVRRELVWGPPPHGPTPNAGDPAPHFPAYYCVVGGEPEALTYQPSIPKTSPPRCGTKGDFYTCMVAQSSLA